jgi:hypothetical protein
VLGSSGSPTVQAIQQRDFQGVLLQQFDELQHHVLAVAGLQLGPDSALKGPARGPDRHLDVFRPTVGDLGQRFPIGRIHRRVSLATGARRILAVNESLRAKAQCGVRAFQDPGIESEIHAFVLWRRLWVLGPASANTSETKTYFC